MQHPAENPTPVERAQHILLSGRPGVGKSTIISRLLERLPDVPARGFYTRELRGPEGRLGFEAVVLGGPHMVLASIGGRPQIGKYHVDVAGFERIVVPAIDPAGLDRRGLIVIDEIGRMEILSAGFRAAVLQTLASPAFVLGTVGQQDDPFLKAIRARPDVRLIEVRRENREQLVEDLMEAVLQWWKTS